MPMPALPPARRHVEHVEGCAACRRRSPAGGLRRRRRRRARALASSRAARSSSSSAARHRVGAVPGLDGARIGGVDEGERAGLVARPDRRGQRVDQRAQRCRCRGAAAGGRRRARPVRACSPLTSRSRSTARPPIARPSASIVRCCSVVSVHGEAFAVGAQRVDRVLHRLRLVGLEPGAERQHALRHGGARRPAWCRRGCRARCRPRPRHHDHLRLGQQQRVDAVALGRAARRSRRARRARLARSRMRVRTSEIAVMTANSSTPSVSASAASSCRSSAPKRRRGNR